jgi:hypothetical protein
MSVATFVKYHKKYKNSATPQVLISVMCIHTDNCQAGGLLKALKGPFGIAGHSL